MRTHILLVLICLFEAGDVFSQSSDSVTTVSFYQGIQKYDLSRLWLSDTVAQSYSIERPFGFIGDSFQRFYIHFSYVRQNPKNHYNYFVKGKTRVRDNICDFSGTIVILKARIDVDSEVSDLDCASVLVCAREGLVDCKVSLYESKSQHFAGHIVGTLESWFYIKSGDSLKYDDLDGCADGYCNNQFIGTWKSYAGGSVKKCNWGDDRIPESNVLDEGAGEFGPDPKYYKFGWGLLQKSLVGVQNLQSAEDKALITHELNWWR